MWHLKKSIFGFRTKPALVSKIRRPDYEQLREAGSERLNSNNLSMRGIPCLFVCCGIPATRETDALIAPWVNMEIMTHHLQQVATRTQPVRHAVVIMDGAGWHTDEIAQGIDNLRIIKLPPYLPELDPIEQVWQWLKQNELPNRCFEGYEDIVEQCCRAWNSFISDSKRVASLCSRDWIEVGN
jgi:hypothetical protein